MKLYAKLQFFIDTCKNNPFFFLCITKKALLCVSNAFFLLGYPDSNQERQDQNLQCYHYTISQSLCVKTKVKIKYPSVFKCKVTTFLCNFQIFLSFFLKKPSKNAIIVESQVYSILFLPFKPKLVIGICVRMLSVLRRLLTTFSVCRTHRWCHR